MTLAGQRVVVVGGTSGMGAATARAAARQGAHVLAAGRRPVSERDASGGVEHAEVRCDRRALGAGAVRAP